VPRQRAAAEFHCNEIGANQADGPFLVIIDRRGLRIFIVIVGRRRIIVLVVVVVIHSFFGFSLVAAAASRGGGDDSSGGGTSSCRSLLVFHQPGVD
jgi:hypothetical protein